MRLPLGTLRDPIQLVALGFGTGLSPWAPGTAGSLLALLPAWWCFTLPLPWRIAIVAAVVVLGVWICGVSARRLGVHDHSAIVFDEIAGLLAASLATPARTWFWFALTFVLFRVFDIVKPWPIRDVDHRMRGGSGIMLDDLMAAAYAAICLMVSRALLPTI
ncbi:MAG TPA: phosphatidylglycerophosphatase A [Gammaproteobacteria bacterium]|nr:phosphatidylglycerophosphatase A [Gammaproteobacteria bacterium]